MKHEPMTDAELDELERIRAEGMSIVFAEDRLLVTVRELQGAVRHYQDALRTAEIADAQRVMEWARDPNRKDAGVAFTSGADRQAAYWIEWAEGGRARVERVPALLDLKRQLEDFDRAMGVAPIEIAKAAFDCAMGKLDAILAGGASGVSRREGGE